jgi:hypothetical protein
MAGETKHEKADHEKHARGRPAVGTTILVRLPDVSGKERMRPAVIVDQERGEARVMFSRLDIDVASSFAWACPCPAAGTKVGEYRLP